MPSPLWNLSAAEEYQCHCPPWFFFEEEYGKEMEHNLNSALSPSLPRFGCFWVFMFDVFQSKRREGVGRNQNLSSHLFLPPFSKYRGFWASFSMGTGIKTDISKYFPVVTWVPTAVLVSWKSIEVIPSLRKNPAVSSLCLSWRSSSTQSCPFKSSYLQHTSPSFPGLWGCC